MEVIKVGRAVLAVGAARAAGGVTATTIRQARPSRVRKIVPRAVWPCIRENGVARKADLRYPLFAGFVEFVVRREHRMLI